MSSEDEFEEYFFSNRFEEGATNLSSAYSFASDASEEETELLLVGLRLWLFLGEDRKADKALQRLIDSKPVLNQTNTLESMWIRALITYNQGDYPACIKELQVLRKETVRLEKAECLSSILFGRMLICRMHILFGKAFRRHHDLFSAKLHLGLALHFCQASEEYLQIEEHYLRARVIAVYARIFIDYRHGDLARKLLSTSREMHERSFKNKKYNWEGHLLDAELLELEGHLESENGQWQKGANLEKALTIYQDAQEKLMEIFGTTPNRRSARLLRLRGYYRVILVTNGQKKRELGLLTDDDLLMLKLSVEDFIKEIELRKKIFGEEASHPTLSRAYNNLSFTCRLLARGYLKQGNTDQGLDYYKLAKESARLAAARHGGNLSQKMKAIRRSMELLGLQYFNPEVFGKDQGQLAVEMEQAFQQAYQITWQKIAGLSEKSCKNTFHRRLHAIQEIYLSVLFHQLRNESGEEERHQIKEKALIAFLTCRQSSIWRTGNEKAACTLDRRVGEGDDFTTSSGTQMPKDFPQDNRRWLLMFVRKNFEGILNEATIEMQYRYGQSRYYDRINDLRNLVSVQRGFNSSEVEKETFLPTTADFTEILQGQRGGLIAYCCGSEHLYAFVILNQNCEVDEARRIKFVRITSESYREVAELEHAAKILKNTISRLTRLNSKEGVGGVIISDRSSKLNEEFPELHPNLIILNHAARLYKSLVKEAEIDPKNLEYLYFIPDSWLWERVPMALLFDDKGIEPKDLPVGTKYRDIKECFLGYRCQIAVMPSLLNLYKLGKESRQRRNWDEANPALVTLAGTDGAPPDSPGYHSGMNMLKAQALDFLAESLELALPDFSGRDRNWHPFSFGDAPIEYTVSPSKVFTLWVYKSLKEAMIFYYFGHTRLVEQKYYDRSLYYHSSPRTDQAIQYSYLEITREVIADLNLTKNELTFINACGAFEGNSLGGGMPLSLFSAFMEAGSHAVVGTLYDITPDKASRFAKIFFNELRESSQKTLGEVLHLTVRRALDDEESLSNPISWSPYILMADLFQRVQLMKRKESP